MSKLQSSILMTPHFSSLTAAYQLHFYLWFKTKYGRPLLQTNEACDMVQNCLTAVSAREDYHLLETDTKDDVLRILISLNPTQTVSQVVKLLKGNLSYEFGRSFRDYLKAYDSRSLWARGFFARSSGRVDLERARKYVDSQASHHGYRGDWHKAFKFKNLDFKSPAFHLEHSLCLLNYHVVLATQNRLPLFDEVIAPELFKYILKIGAKFNFAVDRIGLMPDHLHLIIEAVPSLSIEQAVLGVLENTRYWMTNKYAGVLKQLDAWDVWQPSYYAGTVGEYSTAQVRQFLKL